MCFYHRIFLRHRSVLCLVQCPSPPSTVEQREVPPARRAGDRGIIRRGFLTAQLLIPYQSCSRALHCRVDSSHGSLWALVCDTKALMSCLHRSPVFCGSPPCAPTRSASNPGPGRCVRFSRPWREQSSRVRSSHVWPWARGRASSRCAGRALEVCKGHTGSVLGARCRLACRCHCTAGSSAGSAGPRVLRRAHWDTCVRETVWGVAGGTMRRERNEIPGNSMSLLYWLC